MRDYHLPAALAVLTFAPLFFSGCVTDIPAEADLEVTARPTTLIARSERMVEAYARKFPSYKSRTRKGVRTISVQDRGRTITAKLSDGICRSLHISGRLGEALYPRTPGDLAELRDFYAGDQAWVSASPSAGNESNQTSGSQVWTSADGSLQATSSWTLDSAESRAGSYELSIRSL